MIEINWVLFIIASVAVILTPGQDLLLVMSRSMTQGAAAGVATAAGVSSGLMAHTLLATLGVGAIVMASQWLYLTMKFVGAMYLIYLGVSLLRVNNTGLQADLTQHRSAGKLYFDGAFSNVANPKIAIFYFAFLPQFVAPQSENPTLAIFILGASFALLTFLIKAPVGYFSGQLSNWFKDN
ncbi:MAG: LysE family translocator, partial [Pseudomonadota bacterium]